MEATTSKDGDDSTSSTTKDGLTPPKRRWIEAGLIVAFWASIFMLTVGQRAIDPRGPDGLRANEVLDPALEYLLWLFLTPAIFWLAHRFSVEHDNWMRHIALHVFIALAVGVAMDAFGHYTYHTLVRGHEGRPFSFLRSLRSLRFLDELIIYLTVLAAGFARNFFLRYRERQEEASALRTRTAALQAQLAEARLDALRMQINPHFLFNTLHAVSTLVGHDPRGVRRMISRLSELLRYTLESRGDQEVPLKEELEFLEGYLEIQRIRFQGKLTVEEEIGTETLDALVPNLILQPLVENAIKHGVSQIEGHGRIELRARREGAMLYLTVRDNGPGLEDTPPDELVREGVGLRNVRERLENHYGEAQSLTLDAADGGLVATIVLPYHTRRDLRTTEVAEPARERDA